MTSLTQGVRVCVFVCVGITMGFTCVFEYSWYGLYPSDQISNMVTAKLQTSLALEYWNEIRLSGAAHFTATNPPLDQYISSSSSTIRERPKSASYEPLCK